MYSIKVELKLNNKEKTLMDRHIGYSRFCYNFALSLYNQLDHSEYKGSSSKKIDMIRKVFNNHVKTLPEYAWTRTLSSRVYQHAFRNLKKAFNRFFQGLGKYPRFKRKKQPGSFTVDNSRGKSVQEGGKRIKLPTLGTFRTKEIIPKCVSQTYTISRRGDRYYVSFSIHAELIPPIIHEVIESVGVDVNLTDGKYCVLSDGTEITFPKPLKAAITKLKKFQYRNRNKQLGNRSTPASSNAKKYYKKLAKLHKQVADRRNDFLQKLTTNLARKYYHLRVETLNIQGMLQNKKLAFHVGDASFYKFKSLLEAKALTHGGIVESVSQWYPSSKLCSQCNRKKSKLGLSDRIYYCDSPFCQPMCRDLNSAINLANAPSEQITNRVGSIRINACGHDTADGCDLKQEINTNSGQLLLPLTDQISFIEQWTYKRSNSDPDNAFAGILKVTLDGLVLAGILPNDTVKDIKPLLAMSHEKGQKNSAKVLIFDDLAEYKQYILEKLGIMFQFVLVWFIQFE